MARRGIHNEGARILQERLEGKADLDKDTARRLFTLVCVLHFWGLNEHGFPHFRAVFVATIILFARRWPRGS